MKFFKSEKNHFSEKTFLNIKKSHQSYILIFAIEIIIIISAIEIIIKIKTEKALQLNSLEFFFEKVILSDLKNFVDFMTI